MERLTFSRSFRGSCLEPWIGGAALLAYASEEVQMKRLIGAFAISVLLTLTAVPTMAAPDVYDESQSHPLRIAAYLAYPFAYAVEWIVFRPFHFLVSSYPEVFGHHPHGADKLES